MGGEDSQDIWTGVGTVEGELGVANFCLVNFFMDCGVDMWLEKLVRLVPGRYLTKSELGMTRSTFLSYPPESISSSWPGSTCRLSFSFLSSMAISSDNISGGSSGRNISPEAWQGLFVHHSNIEHLDIALNGIWLAVIDS